MTKMIIKPVIFALQLNKEKPFYYTESHEKAQKEHERIRTHLEFNNPGWTKMNDFKIVTGEVDWIK